MNISSDLGDAASPGPGSALAHLTAASRRRISSAQSAPCSTMSPSMRRALDARWGMLVGGSPGRGASARRRTSRNASKLNRSSLSRGSGRSVAGVPRLVRAGSSGGGPGSGRQRPDRRRRTVRPPEAAGARDVSPWVEYPAAARREAAGGHRRGSGTYASCGVGPNASRRKRHAEVQPRIAGRGDGVRPLPWAYGRASERHGTVPISDQSMSRKATSAWAPAPPRATLASRCRRRRVPSGAFARPHFAGRVIIRRHCAAFRRWRRSGLRDRSADAPLSRLVVQTEVSFRYGSWSGRPGSPVVANRGWDQVR